MKTCLELHTDNECIELPVDFVGNCLFAEQPAYERDFAVSKVVLYPTCCHALLSS